ncbi:MAG: efflux RND transporter periplasmic adaptor subunit [Acidobacteriota bacterium]
MFGTRSVFTLSIAFLLPVLAGCGNGQSRGSRTEAPPPLVEAVESRFGALPIEEIVPGVVRARNQVGIRPEIDGRVVEVLVRSGEPVKQNQPLVRLDGVEARERLRQAEADVRLSEAAAIAARARVTELDARVARTRSLAEQELVSVQDLESLEAQLDALRASADEAAARVEQSRAAVEERRSALEKTVVRAPVAGRLGERRAEVGMLVDPSTLLFVVGDLDELIVEVNLTEAMLARVDEGLPVVIETRSTAFEPISAQLSRISPFLAEESFTTIGEIDVDNRGGALRPGMFVTVRILVGQSRQASVVPMSAVWDDPTSGRRGIFVVEESAGLETSSAPPASTPTETRDVSFEQVDVLAQGRGAVGVTGLADGAWVVTVGQHLLAAELRAATSAGEPDPRIQARIRPVTWNRVSQLQDMQDEDLLDGFLDKQRKVAAVLGAEIPESEDVVEKVLEEASATDPSQSDGI